MSAGKKNQFLCSLCGQRKLGGEENINERHKTHGLNRSVKGQKFSLRGYL